MELAVIFRNKRHQKLVGTLLTPQGQERCPCVVLCHGFAAHKDALFFPQLAQRLVEEGLAVLRFDCRSCGKSEGELHPTYKTMVDDLQAAITFARSQERVEAVGLAGHSMGGTSVIMAASQDPQVQAAVSFAGVAYPDRSAESKREAFVKEGERYACTINERTYLFSEGWFSDARATRPLEALKDLHAALLLVHGTADNRVSIEESKELFLRANIPKSIKIVEGASHLFTGYEKPLIESTASFFKIWLKKENEED